MEKYDQISVVGEGSYGVVLKCKHRETNQLVAVKKFLETEEDVTVRRMALREIRMLKRLKHENMVTMIEVFRYRKRFYLVFEFLEGTILDELEKTPGGLGPERTRERIFQVTRAINYCHCNNIIHRDVKPENVLVSSAGVVKLCDFGFARQLSPSGEPCTEYVATRWYRAPELLVGETFYGGSVDIWAIGCLFAEMMTSDPIFPGESDIDQLYLIVKTIGKPCVRHQKLMAKHAQLRGMIKCGNAEGLAKLFPTWPQITLDFLGSCLKMDPEHRLSSYELLNHEYFMCDKFPERFVPCIRERINTEFNQNPLLRRYRAEIIMSTDKAGEMRPPKKVSPREQLKWKLNLIEANGKRKLSSDLSTGDIVHIPEDKYISLDKSSQRLNVISTHKPQPQTRKEKSQVQIAKTTPTKQAFAKHDASKEGKLTQSTAAFQSLSQAFIFGENPDVTQLHPSIDHITFHKEGPKKSPTTHTTHMVTIKPTINQMPLFQHKSQFLKKMERGDMPSMMGDSPGYNPAASWLSGISNNLYNKKRETKMRSDFTLPTLPGATTISSPTKPKKKSLPELEGIQSTQITPAYRYRKSKRKLQTLDITLPLSVKENG